MNPAPTRADTESAPFQIPRPSNLSLRAEMCLDKIEDAERAAMSGVASPHQWLVPLVLVLARMAADEDVANTTTEVAPE